MKITYSFVHKMSALAMAIALVASSFGPAAAFAQDAAPEAPAVETEQTVEQNTQTEETVETAELTVSTEAEINEEERDPEVLCLIFPFLPICNPAPEPDKTITVIKVLEDAPEGATCDDFSFTIEKANSVVATQSFEADCTNVVPVTANGSYIVYENDAEGYDVEYSDNVNPNNTPGCHLQGINSAHPNETCTIKNTYDAPEVPTGTVVVEKLVTGGSKVPGDFSFEVKDAGNVTVATQNFNLNNPNPGNPQPWEGPNKGRNVVTLPAGTYTIIEVPVAGYSAAYVDGGAVNSPGQPCTVTIVAGTTPGNGAAVCGITNTYQPILTDDACPNIPEIQATIPEGMVKDDAGNCVPAASTATINATKIVCPTEISLPNWGAGAPDITSTTATNFLVAHPECSVQPWTFEWRTGTGSGDPFNPGDSTVAGGAPWATFVSTAVVPASAFVWVREQFDTDYIPFTGANQNLDVSAEIYCSTDGLNYDNFDFVNNMVAGGNYYCVAFNVLVDQPDDMCELTVVSDSSTQVDGGDATELTSTVNAAWASILGAMWIWSVEPVADATVNSTETFTKTFVWNGPVDNAVLDLAVDNSYTVTINATQVAQNLGEFNYGATATVAIPDGVIVNGVNTITFEATNIGVPGSDGMSNPAGVIYKLYIAGENCPDDGDGDGDDDDTFTLHIDTSGEGNGIIMGDGINCDSNSDEDDCSQDYPEGTEVVLTVTSDEGSNFNESWAVGAGTCTGNNTPCTVTMSANTNLNAHFTLNQTPNNNPGNRSSGSSRSGSGGGNDDDGEVLGAQTEIMPAGAPNTGLGGAATGSFGTILTLVSILGLAARKRD